MKRAAVLVLIVIGTGSASAQPQTFHPALLAGGAVVFSQTGMENEDDLFLASASAPRPTNLTRSPGRELEASWSPDGQRLVFVRRLPGNNELFVMDVNDTRVRRITHTEDIDEEDPVWSPDGSRIAYVRRYEGIFVMPAVGGPSHRIAVANALHQVRYPAWSPDGSHVAFERDDYKSTLGPLRSSLRIVGATGGRERALTTGPNDGSPAWTPDGVHLAFQRRGGKCGSSIWLVRAAGRSPRQLTNACRDGSAGSPAWSPDGSRLATIGQASTGRLGIIIFDQRGRRLGVLLTAEPARFTPGGVATGGGFSLGLAWRPKHKPG